LTHSQLFKQIKASFRLLCAIKEYYCKRVNRILSKILPSRVTPYIDEIIGDHLLDVDWNGTITNHIICICQILKIQWDFNGAVHQLFMDLKSILNSRNTCYHFIQYGCETWSLKLMERQLLRMLENKVLRRICGSKRDEVLGGWRRLRSEKPHKCYASTYTVWVIKSRSVRYGRMDISKISW
jgi:hypothetical protein